MVFALLAWILLAPLGAWIIGAAVAMAEKQVVPGATDEQPCPQVRAEPEFAAVGA